MSGTHLTLGSRSGCCTHVNSFHLIFEVDLEMPGTHSIQDSRSGCCTHMNGLCVIFEVDHEMTARVQPTHAVILVWFQHQLHSGWLLKEVASGSRRTPMEATSSYGLLWEGVAPLLGGWADPGVVGVVRLAAFDPLPNLWKCRYGWYGSGCNKASAATWASRDEQWGSTEGVRLRVASMVHTLCFANCPACHSTDKYLRSYLMIRHMYSLGDCCECAHHTGQCILGKLVGCQMTWGKQLSSEHTSNHIIPWSPPIVVLLACEWW